LFGRDLWKVTYVSAANVLSKSNNAGVILTAENYILTILSYPFSLFTEERSLFVPSTFNVMLLNK